MANMRNNKVKTLLKFDFKANYFKEYANNIFDDDCVTGNIDKLNKVADNLDDSLIMAGDTDIKQAKDDLLKAFDNNIPAEKVLIDKKTLRGLTYSISPDNYKLNQYLLSILSVNWSSSYFGGLLHSLLYNWKGLPLEERKLFTTYISAKITNGESRTSKRLLKAIPYLSENGAYQLGYTLKVKKENVLDCCDIFMLPNNRFNYSYFSDTIKGYFEDNDNIDLEIIEKVLKSHNNVAASKKLIPIIIINNHRNGLVSKELIKLAIETIGDPFNESRWAIFPGATREEENNLLTSRRVLITIISNDFLNIFFNELTYDGRRLNFWLGRTKYIDDFRVFGSFYSKSIMIGKIDSDLLDSHFIITSKNQDTCALVMAIRDFAIVEFTDVGALYVYQRTNDKYKKIMGNKCEIDKMDDLKMPYMRNLIENASGYLYFYEEGRMVHIGNWEYRLESWFNKIVI